MRRSAFPPSALVLVGPISSSVVQAPEDGERHQAT